MTIINPNNMPYTPADKPTVTTVSKTTTSITYSITNPNLIQAKIFYEIGDDTPDANNITLAGGASQNITISNLTESTNYILYTQAFTSTGYSLVTNYSETTAASALFAFTTFTFTNAGTVGRYGPALSTFQSSYSSQPWASNTSYFNQGRAQGYQVFTIPKGGIYEIEIAGARGQNGSSVNGQYGRGAIVRARISFNLGDKVEMVVGQVPGTTGSTAPGNSFAGAGGGSFVAYNNTSTPVIVAGGGGGSYSSYTTQSIINGQTRRQPRFSGYSYNPAVDGTHPSIGGGGLGYHGGGGGGFSTAGQDYNGYTGSSGMGTDGSGQQFTHGASFVGGPVSNGSGTWYALGGNATTLTSSGGFGGGGGGHSGNNTGGGGGGYSGGLGGQTSLGGSYLSGIGGGSFIISTATNVATSDGQYDGSSTFNGTSITNLSTTNDGSGYIKITFIS
jgi:hypothetical protein